MVLTPDQFPSLLQETPCPPHQLYVSGDAAVLTKPAIAVVGSRAMTPYGAAACRYVVEQCVQAGFVVVSGLATGIDAVAHETALRCHGQTMAVLGCGLDERVLFPAAHRALAKRIVAQGGALITEYPATTVAKRHHFIARNRILAGLCLATVIVEAAKHSGAMNTARHALEANRLVCAVPGSIFSSRSSGTHLLIQQGALLLHTIEDVFAELNMAFPRTQHHIKQISTLQQSILNQLEHEPLHAEQLAQILQIGSAQLNINLTELEIQGIVRKNIWMMYEISHR